MSTHYGDFQLGMYMQGMMGVKPEMPIDHTELEAAARAKLDSRAYWYVAGGAGSADTIDANEVGLQRYRIVPRMLTDVSDRDHRVEICGTMLNAPMMLAPVGVQEIVHPEAELAVARAARETGVGMMLSTLSSTPLEAVAEALGNTPKWFQLYWPKDDAVTISLVQRAEKAGYSAIVVTLDTRLMGWRAHDLQEAYLPFLEGKGLANYLTDPAFRAALDETPEENPQAAVGRWAEIYSGHHHTWAQLKLIREATSLPILVKGLLHPADVEPAMAAGVQGIIVSNHGGRQIGGCIGAIDALPGIVQAVGGKVPVLFDSGVRNGSDVIVARALGAEAVLLGRPYVWGLAVGGAEGVAQVIRRFLADYDLHMALAGFTKPAEVTAGALRMP